MLSELVKGGLALFGYVTDDTLLACTLLQEPSVPFALRRFRLACSGHCLRLPVITSERSAMAGFTPEGTFLVNPEMWRHKQRIIRNIFGV